MTSSSSPYSNPDLSLSLTPCSSTTYNEQRSVKLIQLLLKCATHASSGNLHRADECLRRISQLASVSGDSMQRLAARFASALAVRLVKRWPGLYNALNRTEPTGVELDRARSVFAEAFPYLGFTYAVITRTLIHTMTHERNVHIVDLGSGDPKLWVPFLRSFSNGPNNINLTCVHTSQFVLDKLGIKLAKEAKNLDMDFEFNPINVSLRDLKLEMLKVRSNEALAFTSILNLHVLLSQDYKKIDDFLAMVRSTSPKVMLVVEQESDHNANQLLNRFVEGLHYYSAMFDSINSIHSTHRESLSSEERFVVEEMFGREIENIVACEGMERMERHEKYVKWMGRFCNATFKPVRLWNMEEAKRIVDAFGSDGYKIVNQKTSLMICWHDRPIYFVSAWI